MTNLLHTPLQNALRHLRALTLGALSITLAGCSIEPPLHLHEDIEVALPEVDLELEVLWDYVISYEQQIYDYKAYWVYDWDEYDEKIFGPIGYREPDVFNFYAYYTGWNRAGQHLTAPVRHLIYGNSFTGQYNFGFYDFLIWNEVDETDGAQNTHFEEVGYDYVRAYTNPSMNSSQHPGYFPTAVNQPEDLFAVYNRGVDIPDPGEDYSQHGFVWNEERQKWVKVLESALTPLTYIYLTQVILVNNQGRVTAVDGYANLTGMAYETNVNTHVTGPDPVSVHYKSRMKKHSETGYTFSGTFPNDLATFVGPTDPVTKQPVKTTYNNEPVDIIGGKVLTFGMCNLNPGGFDSRATYAESVQRIKEIDQTPHYIEVPLQFYNGQQAVYSFDVSDQVRTLFKGGVLTVVIDVGSLTIPSSSSSNNGFNAEVKDWDKETHIIDM